MEDENKSAFIIKTIQWIVIIGVILIVLYFVSSYFLRTTNENNFKKYLKEQNFKETNGVWNKKDTITEGTKTSNIQIAYTPSINKYTKEVQVNADDFREQYRFKYNGDDVLDIDYTNTDYANNRCQIIERATYNVKNGKFTCETTYNSNNCSLQCNYIKDLSEDFSKELQELFKKANVKQKFLVKNKDE